MSPDGYRTPRDLTSPPMVHGCVCVCVCAGVCARKRGVAPIPPQGPLRLLGLTIEMVALAPRTLPLRGSGPNAAEACAPARSAREIVAMRANMLSGHRVARVLSVAADADIGYRAAVAADLPWRSALCLSIHLHMSAFTNNVVTQITKCQTCHVQLPLLLLMLALD